MIGLVFKVALAALTLGPIAGLAVAAVYYIKGIIDKRTVAEEVGQRVDNSFRAQILECKRNSVKVGIFDEEDNHIQNISLQSEAGISSELEPGTEIYV